MSSNQFAGIVSFQAAANISRAERVDKNLASRIARGDICE
jgi:hypothetical protein